MAWNDPSPRTRSLSADSRSSPGYGAPELRVSFMTILARTAVALVAGACVYAGVRSVVHADLPGRHPAMDVALPLAVAAVAGWLLLRFLLRQPQSVGRRRGWGDDRCSTSFGEDVVSDVVSAAIDVAVD